MFATRRLPAYRASPFGDEQGHDVGAADYPDELAAGHHGHPGDPSIDQQVPYVLDVGVFRDADDCRGHDVVCSGASKCYEQVVLADQTDNAAVAIDDQTALIRC